jgi:hypothetical protein
VPGRQRFGVDGVERRGGHRAVVEGSPQRILVDQAAPGDVHEVDARLHLRQRTRVDQVAGGVGEGCGDDHVIGAVEHVGEGRDHGHAFHR